MALVRWENCDAGRVTISLVMTWRVGDVAWAPLPSPPAPLVPGDQRPCIPAAVGLQQARWFLWCLRPQRFTGYSDEHLQTSGPFLFRGNKNNFQTGSGGLCWCINLWNWAVDILFLPFHSHSGELIVMFILFLFCHKAFRSLMLQVPVCLPTLLFKQCRAVGF